MDQNKNIFLEIKDKNSDNEYTLKSRLLRFYNCHCPDKIETIDNIVKKYTSKEKELFKSLVAKYGKEPDISNHEKLVIEERLRLQRCGVIYYDHNLRELTHHTHIQIIFYLVYFI